MREVFVFSFLFFLSAFLNIVSLAYIVMQFGAQHRGGIPAVGMAFPGYVAQPNGLGNSEKTWYVLLFSHHFHKDDQ